MAKKAVHNGKMVLRIEFEPDKWVVNLFFGSFLMSKRKNHEKIADFTKKTCFSLDKRDFTRYKDLEIMFYC